MRSARPLYLLYCALGADSFNHESSAHVPRNVNYIYLTNYVKTMPGDEQLTKHQTILDELYLEKSIALRQNYQPASMFVCINNHLSPDLSLYFKLSDPNHKTQSDCHNWSQP